MPECRALGLGALASSSQTCHQHGFSTSPHRSEFTVEIYRQLNQGRGEGEGSDQGARAAAT